MFYVRPLTFSLLFACLHGILPGGFGARTYPFFFFVLRGPVAGSRSVCEFRKRREVTSGFLCRDGQVLWSYCEERKTSSLIALLVNA